MKVIEKIEIKLDVNLNNVGRDMCEKVDDMCDMYYERYCQAYENQYSLGGCGPVCMNVFLMLNDGCLKVLDAVPGTLVRRTSNNSYCIVDKWGMSSNYPMLCVHDKDGRTFNLAYGEFEPAEIPSDIVEIVKKQLLTKCPILNGQKGACDEG